MTTTLSNYATVSESQVIKVSNYSLKWRQNQLWVQYTDKPQQLALFALDNQEVLVNCLKASTLRLVCLDPAMGKTQIEFWADACAQAHKPVYLRIPSNSGNIFLGRLGAVLSIVFGQVILAIMALFSRNFAKKIFVREWCVGRKGRLFQVVKFRTMLVSKVLNKTTHLLGNCSLNEIPELSNA